jgi:hypothetical protein
LQRVIIPMAEPLARHVEGLPVSDDPQAPIHPRAFAVLQAQGKTGGLSNQFADLLELPLLDNRLLKTL